MINSVNIYMYGVIYQCVWLLWNALQGHNINSVSSRHQTLVSTLDVTISLWYQKGMYVLVCRIFIIIRRLVLCSSVWSFQWSTSAWDAEKTNYLNKYNKNSPAFVHVCAVLQCTSVWEHCCGADGTWCQTVRWNCWDIGTLYSSNTSTYSNYAVYNQHSPSAVTVMQ